MSGSKIVIQGFNSTTGEHQDVKINSAGELVTTVGSGGGGTATVDISAASGDNISIKSSTTGNEIEPNSDGSINIKASVIENLLTEIQGLNQVIHSLVISIQRSQPQVDVTNRPMMRINAIDTGLTLSTVSSLNTLGGGNTAGIPYQASFTDHIYNNIKVT